MARTGRPRKPAALHALTGTFQKVRHAKQAKNEARLSQSGLLVDMEPPALLDDAQRAMWRRLMQIAPIGVITTTDTFVFQSLTVAMVNYEEAVAGQNALRAAGQNPVIMRTPKGPQISIFLQAQRHAMETAMKAMTELGFTPSSRARLAAGLPPPPADAPTAQGDPWSAFTVIPGGKRGK